MIATLFFLTSRASGRSVLLYPSPQPRIVVEHPLFQRDPALSLPSNPFETTRSPLLSVPPPKMANSSVTATEQFQVRGNQSGLLALPRELLADPAPDPNGQPPFRSLRTGLTATPSSTAPSPPDRDRKLARSMNAAGIQGAMYQLGH